MIKRNPSKINQSLVNDATEEHLTASSGIHTDTAITDLGSVFDVCNLEVDNDRSLIVRKPIIRTFNSGSPNDFFILLYNGYRLEFKNTEDIIRVTNGTETVKCVLKYTTYTGIEKIDESLGWNEYLDLSNAEVVHTSNTTIITKAKVYLKRISNAIDPNLDSSDENTSYSRYLNVYFDEKTNIWICEIMSPEVNTFTGSDTETTQLNPNLGLDNAYAIRDLYDYGGNTVTNILVYKHKNPMSDSRVPVQDINIPINALENYIEVTLDITNKYVKLFFKESISFVEPKVLVQKEYNTEYFEFRVYIVRPNTWRPLRGSPTATIVLPMYVAKHSTFYTKIETDTNLTGFEILPYTIVAKRSNSTVEYLYAYTSEKTLTDYTELDATRLNFKYLDQSPQTIVRSIVDTCIYHGRLYYIRSDKRTYGRFYLSDGTDVVELLPGVPALPVTETTYKVYEHTSTLHQAMANIQMSQLTESVKSDFSIITNLSDSDTSPVVLKAFLTTSRIQDDLYCTWEESEDNVTWKEVPEFLSYRNDVVEIPILDNTKSNENLTEADDYVKFVKCVKFSITSNTRPARSAPDVLILDKGLSYKKMYRFVIYKYKPLENNIDLYADEDCKIPLVRDKHGFYHVNSYIGINLKNTSNLKYITSSSLNKDFYNAKCDIAYDVGFKLTDPEYTHTEWIKLEQNGHNQILIYDNYISNSIYPEVKVKLLTETCSLSNVTDNQANPQTLANLDINTIQNLAPAVEQSDVGYAKIEGINVINGTAPSSEFKAYVQLSYYAHNHKGRFDCSYLLVTRNATDNNTYQGFFEVLKQRENTDPEHNHLMTNNDYTEFDSIVTPEYGTIGNVRPRVLILDYDLSSYWNDSNARTGYNLKIEPNKHYVLTIKFKNNLGPNIKLDNSGTVRLLSTNSAVGKYDLSKLIYLKEAKTFLNDTNTYIYISVPFSSTSDENFTASSLLISGGFYTEDSTEPRFLRVNKPRYSDSVESVVEVYSDIAYVSGVSLICIEDCLNENAFNANEHTANNLYRLDAPAEKLYSTKSNPILTLIDTLMTDPTSKIVPSDETISREGVVVRLSTENASSLTYTSTCEIYNPSSIDINIAVNTLTPFNTGDTSYPLSNISIQSITVGTDTFNLNLGTSSTTLDTNIPKTYLKSQTSNSFNATLKSNSSTTISFSYSMNFCKPNSSEDSSNSDLKAPIYAYDVLRQYLTFLEIKTNGEQFLITNINTTKESSPVYGFNLSKYSNILSSDNMLKHTSTPLYTTGSIPRTITKSEYGIKVQNMFKAVETSLRTFTQEVSNKPTETLTNLNIPIAQGDALFYNNQIITWNVPEHEDSIYVSDVNSFITPMYNTIDLAYDTEATTILPWRNNLLVFTEKNIYLATLNGSETTTKLVNTTTGIPQADRKTAVGMLNSIIFKSSNKVYKLIPNIYSSADNILNLKCVSSGIEYHLNNIEYSDCFAFSTSDKYHLILVKDNSSDMFIYDYDKNTWTRNTYPVAFTRFERVNTDQIKLFSTQGIWDFDEPFPTELEPYFDYGDVMTYNGVESVVRPFEFYVDFGQKSSSYSLSKQYIESKINMATMSSIDVFPLIVDIATDGTPRPIHIDANSSGAIWKTSLGVLNTDFYAENSDIINTMRTLFAKYSGKGKTIRHRISGTTKSRFKIYSIDCKYRVSSNKQ